MATARRVGNSRSRNARYQSSGIRITFIGIWPIATCAGVADRKPQSGCGGLLRPEGEQVAPSKPDQLSLDIRMRIHCHGLTRIQQRSITHTEVGV